VGAAKKAFFAVGVLFIAGKWNRGRPSWTAAPVLISTHWRKQNLRCSLD
jgi:hypothetical protein